MAFHQSILVTVLLYIGLVFDLMSYVPINIYDHVGTLLPFYEPSNRHSDVIKYNHPSKQVWSIRLTRPAPTGKSINQPELVYIGDHAIMKIFTGLRSEMRKF